MKKYAFVVSLFAIAALAVPAYGAQYSCTGTVSILFVNGFGDVVVSGPGGLVPAGICSVSSATTNFTVEACKTAYATLLAAKLSGQSATVSFNDTLTCSTQPTWGASNTSAWAVSIGQ
jgi:hypothetical protein